VKVKPGQKGCVEESGGKNGSIGEDWRKLNRCGKIFPKTKIKIFPSWCWFISIPVNNTTTHLLYPIFKFYAANPLANTLFFRFAKKKNKKKPEKPEKQKKKTKTL